MELLDRSRGRLQTPDRSEEELECTGDTVQMAERSTSLCEALSSAPQHLINQTQRIIPDLGSGGEGKEELKVFLTP